MMLRSSNTRTLDSGLSEYDREAEPTIAAGRVGPGAACGIGSGLCQSLAGPIKIP